MVEESELLPQRHPTGWLKEQVQLATGQDKNKIFVTHGDHLRSISMNGESLIVQSSKEDKVDNYLGMAAVFDPVSSKTPLSLLGCIHPEQWKTIAESAKIKGKKTPK